MALIISMDKANHDFLKIIEKVRNGEEVILEDNATDYMIEYYTPAPEKCTHAIQTTYKEACTAQAWKIQNYL